MSSFICFSCLAKSSFNSYSPGVVFCILDRLRVEASFFDDIRDEGTLLLYAADSGSSLVLYDFPDLSVFIVFSDLADYYLI